MPSPKEVTFDPNADSALTPAERDMRTAVADPGSLVARRWWNTEGGKEYETVLHWQARAVADVVAKAHERQREASRTMEYDLSVEREANRQLGEEVKELRAQSDALSRIEAQLEEWEAQSAHSLTDWHTPAVVERLRALIAGPSSPQEPSGPLSASTDTQPPQNAPESAGEHRPDYSKPVEFIPGVGGVGYCKCGAQYVGGRYCPADPRSKKEG